MLRSLVPNRVTWAAALVCAVLALAWAPTVSMESAWGWDESMNVGYPSARIALGIRDGAVGEVARTVHDARQYPFVYPAVLGALQAVTGVSELACRAFGRLVWCAGLFGLFLLGRELVRGSRQRGAELVPWIAVGLGALSPMALAYAGSLFLEVPFLVASIFALRAWLRRGRDESWKRELAAGLWVTLAFFTKFNYGLLLGVALFVDLAVEGFFETRAGRARGFLKRAAALAAPPVLGFAWWFVLPLPYGFEMAASHREAFAAFVQGNRDPSMDVGWELRALHWTCFLVVTPRMLLLQAVAMAATLPLLRARPIRLLWILFLAGGLPVWTHNFHVDRFLLPGALPMWCLAAIGMARLLPAATKARAVALVALAFLVLAFPSRDPWLVLRAVGQANEEFEDYQRATLADFRSLSGARPIPTNGISRAETDAYLHLVEPEVDPTTRVGWVGVSNVFSPAALHLGLLERGVDVSAAVRRGDLDRTFVELGYADPGWSREQLLRWAASFDLILATDPIDLTVAHNRAFMEGYRTMLVSRSEWTYAELGTFTLRRAGGEEVPVRVFGCWPAP